MIEQFMEDWISGCWRSLLAAVLEKFNIALSKAKFIVGQNLGFDVNIMGAELHRMGIDSPWLLCLILVPRLLLNYYNYPVVEEV
jgi:hypothetical protein